MALKFNASAQRPRLQRSLFISLIGRTAQSFDEKYLPLSINELTGLYTEAQGCFKFEQSDNPLDVASEPAGFVLYSGPEDFGSSPQRLRGLAGSSLMNARLDGDLSQATYYFWAIGQYGNFGGKIAGPAWKGVDVVELYVEL